MWGVLFSACYCPQNPVLAGMMFIFVALLRTVVFTLGKILQREHITIYLLEQDTDFFSVTYSLFSTTLCLGELSNKECLVVISPQASNTPSCESKFDTLQHRVLLPSSVKRRCTHLRCWIYGQAPCRALVELEEFSGKWGFVTASV